MISGGSRAVARRARGPTCLLGLVGLLGLRGPIGAASLSGLAGCAAHYDIGGPDLRPGGPFGSQFRGTDYPAGSYPIQVVACDVNGDSIPDLVVANAHTDCATILVGRGDGGFAAKGAYCGPSPSTTNVLSGLAVADVNGDGHPDLIFADSTRTLLRYHAPGPDGWDFTYLGSYPASNPIWVVAADINRDSFPDLVTVSGSGDVQVLLGPGPSFKMPVPYAQGTQPRRVVLGSVIGAAQPDLLIAGATQVLALPAVGDGTFVDLGAAPVNGRLAMSYPLSQGPLALALSGRDLVVTRQAANSAQVLLNGDALNGDGGGSEIDGGAAAFKWGDALPTGQAPTALAVADFNCDGQPDLAVVNQISDTVSVLAGEGGGRFAAKQDYPTGLYPTSVAAADLNCDGLIDLVVANSNGESTNHDTDTVTVLLNQGAPLHAPDCTRTSVCPP